MRSNGRHAAACSRHHEPQRAPADHAPTKPRRDDRSVRGRDEDRVGLLFDYAELPLDVAREALASLSTGDDVSAEHNQALPVRIGLSASRSRSAPRGAPSRPPRLGISDEGSSGRAECPEGHSVPVDEFGSEFRWAQLARHDLTPLRDVLGQLGPVSDRTVLERRDLVLVDRALLGPPEERDVRVVQSRERHELRGSLRHGHAILLDTTSEQGDRVGDGERDRVHGVTVVVQDVERAGRLVNRPVQVREDLLVSLKSFVWE